MDKHRYTMIIHWSDENGCYVVSLPEWEGRAYQPVTDGKTYEEAARNGQEALELLMDGETSLPLPHTWEHRA